MREKRSSSWTRNTFFCAASVGMAFCLGLLIGVFIPLLLVIPTESSSAETGDRTRTPTRHPRDPQSRTNLSLVLKDRLVDGVYWTPQAEKEFLPLGYTDDDIRSWMGLCRSAPVVNMEAGCGRMQNRKITLDTGHQACARYRQNMDQIQGELFSFLLARVLGIGNLPPACVLPVASGDASWSRIATHLGLAGWADGKPVVMTQWVEGLEPAHIPSALRTSGRHLSPPDLNLAAASLLEKPDDVLQLIQWSDLILFDYLTANLDRVVNNLYNLQWNPAMMESPAHNLARAKGSGLLLFLDNESGLLHGYRLVSKYEPFHKSLLDSVCVFRRDTVANLRRLQGASGARHLNELYARLYPELSDVLPGLPEKSVRTLDDRISRVLQHVEDCERIFGSVR